MAEGILDWLIGDIDYLQGHTEMESAGIDQLALTQYRDEADYLVYNRGGAARAWSAETETEEFEGSDPGAVFNAAYGDLTRGKVVLVGRLTDIDTPLRIDNSQVAVEGAGRGTHLVPGSNIASTDWLVDIGAASGSGIMQAGRVSNLTVFTGGQSFAGAYRVSNAVNCSLENLSAGGAGIWYMQMDDSRGATYDNTVTAVMGTNVEDGISLRQTGTDYVNRNTFIGGRLDGRGVTGSVGLLVGGTGETANTNKLIGVNIENFAGQSAEIHGDDTKFVGSNTENTNGAGGVLVTSNATDTKFSGMGISDGITDNGTRTMWDGVIGGERLGGIDLSAVSGYWDGQPAMSSGASGLTGDAKYTEWRWDNVNAQWVRVDNGATI